MMMDENGNAKIYTRNLIFLNETCERNKKTITTTNLSALLHFDFFVLLCIITLHVVILKILIDHSSLASVTKRKRKYVLTCVKVNLRDAR